MVSHATRPIRHILCPIDFSGAAELAIRHAAATAAALDARLTLLHVAQPLSIPIADAPLEPMPPLSPADVLRIRPALDRYQQLATRLGAQATSAVVVGRPADVIVDAAADAADLIVMATHGYHGVKRLVLGSVTAQVIREAQCPVMTVPPHADAVRPGPFARVLCAVDFSDGSLRALEVAMTSALTADADLHLAHVLEWPWHEPPAPALEDLPADEALALNRFRHRREAAARQRLTGLVPEGWQARCQASVLHGVPHTALLDLARHAQAEVIVVGVTGRHAIDRAMFGSTTHHLLRRAECPVITIAS